MVGFIFPIGGELQQEWQWVSWSWRHDSSVEYRGGYSQGRHTSVSHCHSVPVCLGLDIYIPVSRYNCRYWAEKWTYTQHLLRLSEFVRVNNEFLMMLWVFYLTSNNTKQEEKIGQPLWKAVSF